MKVTDSILDITLAAARRDEQMATPEGQLVRRMTEGVHVRPLPTLVDVRGSVFELFDPRWAWHSRSARVRVLLHDSSGRRQGMEPSS